VRDLRRPGDTIATSGDHLPVHLGAMPLSVRAANSDSASLDPGDVVVLKRPVPRRHAPADIPMVSPVFLGRRGAAAFYVATRAHHSDVGGMSPGSMPLAREIYRRAGDSRP